MGQLYHDHMPVQISPRYRNDFVNTIAPDRMRPFRRVFGGDSVRSAQLYLLDVRINAAIHERLVLLEVLLREAMHRQLTICYGQRWFDTEDWRLDNRTHKGIANAKRNLPGRHAPGKVVAELMFGTWTNLLEPGGARTDRQGNVVRQCDYETDLWSPALAQAFQGVGTPTRPQIEELALRARWLRNRVSHCEPLIFGIPQHGRYTSATPRQQVRTAPQKAVADLQRLMRHLNPDVAEMVESDHNLDHMLEAPLARDALRHALQNASWWIEV